MKKTLWHHLPHIRSGSDLSLGERQDQISSELAKHTFELDQETLELTKEIAELTKRIDELTMAIHENIAKV